MTKTILVTGGAGFIGSATVRQAIAGGYRVVNVDALTYAANLENVASVSQSPRYVFEQADIRDRSALDQIFARHQPDMVVHMAAESHVDRSITGPADFIETNIVGTFTLLEAARSCWEARNRPGDFRFLQVSTDEVFGALGTEGTFSETSPYSPNSPYSASKAAADHLARAWRTTYGLPVITSVCSNNYGPCQLPEKLIPLTISHGLAQQAIPIYGTGENVRDWLYVEDHAAALLAILAGGSVGETYAIGGDAETTNIAMVERICALLDERHPGGAPHARLIEYVDDRPGHDFRYSIDTSKISKEIGWRPTVTLEEGLAQTVDWYLQHPDRAKSAAFTREVGLAK